MHDPLAFFCAFLAIFLTPVFSKLIDRHYTYKAKAKELPKRQKAEAPQLDPVPERPPRALLPPIKPKRRSRGGKKKA